MNVIANSQGMRLLESFSKLVEKRDSRSIPSSQTRSVFLLLSLKYLCVPSRVRALETWVLGTRSFRKLTHEQALHYMRACNSHSLVKLPVSYTVFSLSPWLLLSILVLYWQSGRSLICKDEVLD